MGKNCKSCPHGTFGMGPDAMSDVCDGCRNDPDTGWGGFTDHSEGKHFNSEEEAKKYYENHSILGGPDEDDESDDYSIG